MAISGWHRGDVILTHFVSVWRWTGLTIPSRRHWHEIVYHVVLHGAGRIRRIMKRLLFCVYSYLYFFFPAAFQANHQVEITFEWSLNPAQTVAKKSKKREVEGRGTRNSRNRLQADCDVPWKPPPSGRHSFIGHSFLTMKSILCVCVCVCADRHINEQQLLFT